MQDTLTVPTQPRLGEIKDVQLKDDSTVDLEDQDAKRVPERCTKEAQGNKQEKLTHPSTIQK